MTVSDKILIQRLSVPSSAGHPSLRIKLGLRSGNQAYAYGYVHDCGYLEKLADGSGGNDPWILFRIESVNETLLVYNSVVHSESRGSSCRASASHRRGDPCDRPQIDQYPEFQA